MSTLCQQKCVDSGTALVVVFRVPKILACHACLERKRAVLGGPVSDDAQARDFEEVVPPSRQQVAAAPETLPNHSPAPSTSRGFFAAYKPGKDTGASIENNASENNPRRALRRCMPAVEGTDANAELSGELLRLEVLACKKMCIQ